MPFKCQYNINFYDNYVAILKLFVDIEVAKYVQRNKVLVEEEQVEVQPEFISNAVMDENVDVNLIRRFFTTDAWLVVKDVVSHKKMDAV